MSDLFAEVERLVDALDAPGVSPTARDRAAELVGLVLAIHQESIEVLFEALEEDARRAVADDARVAPVLLLHGLHPAPVEERVANAIDDTRRTVAPALHVVVEHSPDSITVDLSGPGADQPTVVQSFERAVVGAAPEVADVRIRVPVPVALTRPRPDR